MRGKGKLRESGKRELEKVKERGEGVRGKRECRKVERKSKREKDCGRKILARLSIIEEVKQI